MPKFSTADDAADAADAALCEPTCGYCDTATARIAALEQRQQELLATIVRLTNDVPFPHEVMDWVAQRAALVAEVGSLRARVAELERRVAMEARLNGIIAELRSEARGLYACLRATQARLADHESVEGLEILLKDFKDHLTTLGALHDSGR